MNGFDELRAEARETAIRASLAAAGVADGYLIRPSRLGSVYVAFSTEGVTAVDLAGSAADFQDRYARTHGRRVLPMESAPDRIERHLEQAIRSGRPGSLPLDLNGLSEFQTAVLRKTAEIPGGQVRPYGWVAREIGRPGAVRAVGSALARNPVPLIVPCHRVVRSDGRIGNYSLGDADNKRFLLDSEGLDLDRYETLAGRGVRFIGSDTTRIFCHPTCAHAQRISTTHRIEFRTESQAAADGYRACRVCRPGSASAA